MCSMASDVQQLADVAAAKLQRDIASIARLTRAATSAAVCHAGCRALASPGSFLANDCYPTLEETQHAVEALVHALRAHPMSVDVQDVGCLGLGSWTKDSAEARTLAGAVGAVEAVAMTLRNHAGSMHVLDTACYALAILFHTPHENCSPAYHAGAVNALVNAMRTYPTHVGILNCACMVLGQIFEAVNDAAAAAVQLGAPAVIADALRAFPDNSALQANACHALETVLLFEPTVDDNARLPGAVSCVIHALRVHAADELVQLRACMLLTQLTENQPMNAAEAWRLSAFAQLVSILEMHKAQPGVVEQCVYAAQSLVQGVRSAGMTIALSEAEAEAALCAILAAARAHSANVHVQRAAFILIADLTLRTPQLAVAAAVAGALEAVVHALRAFTNCDVYFYRNICSTLGNLRKKEQPTHSAASSRRIRAPVHKLLNAAP